MFGVVAEFGFIGIIGFKIIVVFFVLIFVLIFVIDVQAHLAIITGERIEFTFEGNSFLS